MKNKVKLDKHEPYATTFKTFKTALESQAFSIFLSAFVFGASWIVATSYKELHLSSSDMWVFAIICLFSLIVFLASITRFKKTLNRLIKFATEMSKPLIVPPFQSLNDELAEGFPSGCDAKIYSDSGFDEKVVSELDDLEQTESSESESEYDDDVTESLSSSAHILRHALAHEDEAQNITKDKKDALKEFVDNNEEDDSNEQTSENNQ